jgi:predicted nucleotidyltransferase component of viral defense system
MVSREDLVAVADATGLTPPVIEKDYILGWLLKGVYQHPTLRERWIFKGGTCLKKCYFETYRFSEDLDFTLLDPDHLSEGFLREFFGEVSRALFDEAGLELPSARSRFEIYSNPRGRPSCQGRIYYRSHFQTGNNFPAVRLDLTADEVLVEPPVSRPVNHTYSDAPAGGILARCYSYEELFAEKMRALGERTRARDPYDVVHLHRNPDYRPEPARVRQILGRKCAFKQIGMITLEMVHAAKDAVTGTWEGMLRHQLPELPPFESFWSELDDVFAWLDRGMARPIVRPAPALGAGQLMRPRFGGLAGIIDNASSIERVRFAAQNRLLVELQYSRLDGQPRSPVIEPYSLRRSQAGNLSLAGFDVDAGHIKMYRVERIRGVRVLDRTFVARYMIELGPPHQ